jgi:nucleoside-diphosphate-sugar epimerase
VHVDDLAAAVAIAIRRDVAAGRSYDLAGPEPLTLRTVVEQAAAAVGRRPRIVAVPLRPVIGAARLYERVARSPRIRAEQVARLAEDKAFDIGPARADLGFTPRPFSQGIAEEAALLP